MWTDEMRAKAAATRARKKEQRNDENHHNGRRSSSPQGSGDTQGNNGAGASGVPLAVLQRHHSAGRDDDFDWEEAHLSEAINKAAEMKRELDRVQAIILRRRNPPRAMWTCWTEENRKTLEIPRKVLQECLRKGEDGKWKFRDDGRFVVVDGVRTLKPAFCCNYLCYSAYQKHRVTPPAREVVKLT